MRRLEHYWYHKNPLVMLLVPLSWLFCMVSMLRRKAYQSHLLNVARLPVPVIIVGNISVGGTGKTPLVVWLVDFLKQAGYKPAIISRGYGGSGGGRKGSENGAQHWPQRVTPGSDAATVGDEAVLLARRCVCPMAVAPNRVAAAQQVLENNVCDIIVCDDGLQHYALARDIEIAVIDGVRRFGNGYCLPAGPLREPPGRLHSVDFVVVNGGLINTVRQPQFSMDLRHGALRQVGNDNKSCDISTFHGQTVHAVAGIGHPARFFQCLQGLGLKIIEHAFPDHHPFTAQDLQFGDGDHASVIMTEKDAVKCRDFARENHWYMPVDAQLDPEFGERLLKQLKLNQLKVGKVSNG